MGAAPKITRIMVIRFAHEIQNLTLEDMYGFDMVYKEGSSFGRRRQHPDCRDRCGRARRDTRRH